MTNFEHSRHQAELDARVEHVMLAHEDSERSAGFLYDSTLRAELDPFFRRDGAVDAQLPTAQVENVAGCADRLKSAESAVVGHPRGTWLLIERYFDRDGKRTSSWTAAMSTGGPDPHVVRYSQAMPTFASVHESMVTAEIYDSRARVNARRANEREAGLRGQWPIGTILKGIRANGKNFSGRVTDIDADGKISLQLTRRGSRTTYNATVWHAVLDDMIKAHAADQEVKNRIKAALA